MKNKLFYVFPNVNKQAGYTITEMMIAIAIVGILTLSVGTILITTAATKNMRSDGRDLLGTIQRAKLEAIKRNTCVGVVLNPAAAPPADLSGVTNRGSYNIFIDDGRGGGNACNALIDGTESTNPLMMARAQEAILVKDGVAMTRSTNPSTPGAGNDPNFNDLFDSITFNNRGIAVQRQPDPLAAPFTSIVLRNDPNPANASWWGRIVINNMGGGIEYQTNNLPANQGSWSE